MELTTAGAVLDWNPALRNVTARVAAGRVACAGAWHRAACWLSARVRAATGIELGNAPGLLGPIVVIGLMAGRLVWLGTVWIAGGGI